MSIAREPDRSSRPLARDVVAKESRVAGYLAVIVVLLSIGVGPLEASEQAGSGRSGATGDWGGARDRWARDGVELWGDYTFDFSSVVSGGFGVDHANRGLLNLGATFDLERMSGLRGGTLFVGFQSFRGHVGSEMVGDVQGYSNIDADPFESIAQIWFEQRLLGDRFRVKVGRIDANSEFAFVGPGEAFLNSSAGFSPTILVLPTYPDATLGLTLAYAPTDRVYVRAGTYRSPLDGDTHNDSLALFGIGEVGVSWNALGAGGRAAIGVWADTANHTRFDEAIENGTEGWYSVAEQRIRTGPASSLGLFAQFGQADRRVSEVTRHWGLGLVRDSIFGRPRDSIGLMISAVKLGPHAGLGDGRSETALELFYNFGVNRYLFLRPDLQRVSRPAVYGGARNSIVATLRVGIAF